MWLVCQISEYIAATVDAIVDPYLLECWAAIQTLMVKECAAL